MNDPYDFEKVELSGKAICVGIGLNIALLACNVALFYFVGQFFRYTLPYSILPFLMAIFFIYILPFISMTFTGFAVAHVAKKSIYNNCSLAGIVSPIVLLVLVYATLSQILGMSSAPQSPLEHPLVLAFFFMHFPAMLFGGFIYKKYFKLSTKSNQLAADLELEYLE